MLADAEAVTPLASVTLNDSVKVPLTSSVTLKVPVPEYGDVPPVADTVQLNGLPAVAPESHVNATTNGWGATLTPTEAEAAAPLASVTVNDSTNVPLTGSVTVNVPVPE